MRRSEIRTALGIAALASCLYLTNAARCQSVEPSPRPTAIPAINYWYEWGAYVRQSPGGVMSYHISSTPTYIPPSPYVRTSIPPTAPSVLPAPSTLPPAPTAPQASPAPTQQKESAFVTITDQGFSSNTLVISRGSTVRWINTGKERHTVTADSGLWDSGQIEPGATYTITFAKPGTYQYHCENHKGMAGTIAVQE